MEKKTYSVASVIQSCDNAKEFTLAPDDGRNISFKPGQFAMLYQLDEGGNFGKPKPVAKVKVG